MYTKETEKENKMKHSKVNTTRFKYGVSNPDLAVFEFSGLKDLIKDRCITQSNELIDSQHRLSSYISNRLIGRLLSYINSNDKEFKRYRFTAKELSILLSDNVLGLERSGKFFQNIKAAID